MLFLLVEVLRTGTLPESVLVENRCDFVR
jgi:hypothetical protein